MLQEYSSHIKDVQKDRALEGTLQTENIFQSSKAILFIQTDGMDQAKWSVPRYPENRPTKATAGLIRPGCYDH